MAKGTGVVITDTALPALKRVRTRVQSRALRNAVGFGVKELLQDHFFQLDRTRPNRLGGKRSHFYAKAAQATFHKVVSKGVIAGTAHPGMAQRFFGGTIRPRKAKALTIPIHPEAHGKRAREFDDLALIQTGTPGVAILAKTGKNTFIPFFILLRSVFQEPDPTVLPKDSVILNVALFHAARSLQRLGLN